MALKRYISAFEDQARVVAELDVGSMWDRVLGEFIAEWTRLNRQRLGKAELERALAAFMADLSSKPLEDVARTSSSVAYNQGRAAEILTAGDREQVDFVVRSEILDANTCPTCQALDGTVVAVDDPDFHRLMPPALCEGGDRCRGFYVPISRGLA
jgi:hypothetical protein